MNGFVRNRELRALEYRRLAQAATALAETSALGHVREKHQLAAVKWVALAELDERPVERISPESPAAVRDVVIPSEAAHAHPDRIRDRLRLPGADADAVDAERAPLAAE